MAAKHRLGINEIVTVAVVKSEYRKRPSTRTDSFRRIVKVNQIETPVLQHQDDLVKVLRCNFKTSVGRKSAAAAYTRHHMMQHKNCTNTAIVPSQGESCPGIIQDIEDSFEYRGAGHQYNQSDSGWIGSISAWA